MNRLRLYILVGMLAFVTACNVSLPQGNNGSIGMMPFWDKEMGVQGIRPVCQDPDCTELSPSGNGVYLIQEAIPLPTDEAVAMLLEQTDLVALPKSVGIYKGSALTWNLYKFETRIQDLGSAIYTVKLALAEYNSTPYVVAIAILPTDYAANPALYDTLYTHALYALAPME